MTALLLLPSGTPVWRLEPGMRPGILLFCSNTDCNSSLEWHIIEIPTATPMFASMPDSMELVLNTVCLLPSGGNVKCRPWSWKRWFYPMNDLSHWFQYGCFNVFCNSCGKEASVIQTPLDGHGQLHVGLCMPGTASKETGSCDISLVDCDILVISTVIP